MPHLSPMSWTMSILMFWSLLLIMSTSHWWSQPHQFFTPLSLPTNKSKTNWMWL